MNIDKEKLRASIPIESFYREYLGEPVRKANQGSTYFCIFHDDKKNPNLFVFNDGRYKCFACNEGGDIEIGDLLVTSSTAGYFMKQTDDIVRNYTAGKSGQNVVFGSETNKDNIYCIMMCG